jgi:hypothetical protein
MAHSFIVCLFFICEFLFKQFIYEFMMMYWFLLSCSLEIWYFMALILFAGYLENAEVSVDALSIW